MVHRLAEMYRRFPSAKWYAVVGDDVFLDGRNLRRLLSAFDGEAEEWCLGEADVAASGQARLLSGGSAWRLYGGVSPSLTHFFILSPYAFTRW
jgi:hypothetical protein